MSNFEKLQRRLEAGETILMDGGMGSEFDRRGLASPTTWSGGPMLTHPESGEGRSPGLYRSGRRDYHHKHLQHRA